MQVPEELILRKDVSELLPVYMLMYAKYSPFYDLRFYSYTSLEEPFNEKKKERDFISAGSARTGQESGCLQRVKKPEEYTNGLT
jgi:hypothetical protein